MVVQDALLAVHAVFGDVLRGDPPLGRQIGRIAGVEEGIVAGIRQEGLKGEGRDGEDAGEEGDDHENQRDHILAGLAQIDLGDLAGLAGDGGIVLAAVQGDLVEQHDRHAEEHHDDGQNARLAGILGVHGDVFGRQRGQAQIMRHGIGAHGAAENQKDGGQNGRLDHGQRDAEHGFPARRVENGRSLLQIGVHVPEDAADQDVGEGRIVQAQHDEAGKQALAPPHRHIHAEQGGQQAVGGAGDGVGIEKVLPDDGQRPLRHDVGENKDGA